jgi:hypothetical protein
MSIPKIQKYVSKKYFQIVLLVLKLLLNFFMQLLSSGYKSLEVFICIFHSLDWFKVFMICTSCIHNIILYKIIIFIIIIIYNPKFKKLAMVTTTFGVHVGMIAPNYLVPKCWTWKNTMVIFISQNLESQKPFGQWFFLKRHKDVFTSYKLAIKLLSITMTH